MRPFFCRQRSALMATMIIDEGVTITRLEFLTWAEIGCVCFFSCKHLAKLRNMYSEIVSLLWKVGKYYRRKVYTVWPQWLISMYFWTKNPEVCSQGDRLKNISALHVISRIRKHLRIHDRRISMYYFSVFLMKNYKNEWIRFSVSVKIDHKKLWVKNMSYRMIFMVSFHIYKSNSLIYCSWLHALIQLKIKALLGPIKHTN